MPKWLPKSAQRGARKALAEIYDPEDRKHVLKAVKAFRADYGTEWPKAVAKITDHVDVLLDFSNNPFKHWVHLRTTIPIESTFATVRLRQRVTEGPGSRAAGVAMAFKLMESAQSRWWMVNAPHRVVLVRAGAVFNKGQLVGRPADSGGEQLVAQIDPQVLTVARQRDPALHRRNTSSNGHLAANATRLWTQIHATA